jgi:ligand-binding sensor domain-containing protein
MQLLFLLSMLTVMQYTVSQPLRNRPVTLTDTLVPVKNKRSLNKDGIVFFSSDNGATWMNGSDGLPDDAQIGLGAIAVAKGQLGVTVKNHGVYLFDFKLRRWKSIPTSENIIKANPASLIFYHNAIYLGSQFAGVYVSKDYGKHWKNMSTGLVSQTIRRFMEVDNKLYAGTNAGLFSYNEVQGKWELEYGNSSLQVNGMASSEGYIYIGTNQGGFLSAKNSRNWKQMLARPLHNINAIGNTIYAMTYNELFVSGNKGASWQSMQKGMPYDFYTFNVISSRGAVLAGQWDGVYRRDENSQEWKNYGIGLPVDFALTNMKVHDDFIVVSGSGMTSGKMNRSSQRTAIGEFLR